MLILKSSKIYFPNRTKTVTIIKAIIFDLLLISLFTFLSIPCVKDTKTVMLEIGLVIAKKPVNTVIANVIKLSIFFKNFEAAKERNYLIF